MGFHTSWAELPESSHSLQDSLCVQQLNWWDGLGDHCQKEVKSVTEKWLKHSKTSVISQHSFRLFTICLGTWCTSTVRLHVGSKRLYRRFHTISRNCCPVLTLLVTHAHASDCSCFVPCVWSAILLSRVSRSLLTTGMVAATGWLPRPTR